MALAGTGPRGEGDGRDVWWVVGPAITGLGPAACPPPPAVAHPVTGQLASAQTAASRGSLRSRASAKPGTAVDLSPARTGLPALTSVPHRRQAGE